MAHMTRIGLVAAVLALGAIAAGCGGSDAPEVAELPTVPQVTETAATTGTAEPGDAQDILVEFTGCLREQGLDIPDPDFTASPVEARKSIEAAGIDLDDPAVQEKIDACRPILLGILQTLSPEQIQGYREAFVAYAQCMRSSGLDVPDPDFTRGLDLFGGSIDPDDPAFAEADAECRKVFDDSPNPFEES